MKKGNFRKEKEVILELTYIVKQENTITKLTKQVPRRSGGDKDRIGESEDTSGAFTCLNKKVNRSEPQGSVGQKTQCPCYGAPGDRRTRMLKRSDV
jgi:hypothetical protein